MKRMITALCLAGCLCYAPMNAFAWGFWAHQKINYYAVFTLPSEMMPLFKSNIQYLTTHAVDPDKRRYSLAEEGSRHFIDLDHYCTLPCDSLPHRWNDAVTKYSEDTLKTYGIVPWHIQVMMKRLQYAFEEKDKHRILQSAAELGHYVADAHVPLHTSENYDGQLTGQQGIHAFWESRIPEILGEQYDALVGRATYIQKPLEYTWSIVMDSHTALDSVFLFEKKLSSRFPEDQRYVFEQRGTMQVKTYARNYALAYNDMMGDMVERRFRSSIIDVGSLWYTCWMNAGQPDLKHLNEKPVDEKELELQKQMEEKWRSGLNSNVIGHKD